MLSDQIMLRCSKVGKKYRLYRQPSDRLKQFFFGKSKTYHHDFWALKDINFELKKGETLGILGRNGAGKSTLLQIISGTLSVTEGEVEKKGRLTALLELGSGFNPEMTGLENIYIYGSLMGLAKSEIEAKLDEIQKFADIGEFIHRPVKTYSSGMFVRLAFSIAVHVDPEIMIVDEALSVGDLHFQQKCFKKMKELRDAGLTMLFVSHDTEMVKRICNKAIVLHDGQVVNEGEPGAVSSWYISLIAADFDLKKVNAEIPQEQPKFSSLHGRFGDGSAEITEVRVSNPLNASQDPYFCAIEKNHSFVVKTRFNEDRSDYIIGILIKDKLGVEIVALNTFQEGVQLPPMRKGQTLITEFSFALPLKPSEYSVSATVAYSQHEMKWMDWIDNAILIKVVDQNPDRLVFGLCLPSERKVNLQII